MSLLDRVTGPADLKRLSLPALRELAREIREFLIDKVSGVGGRLGSNLGVVELTIAVHALHPPQPRSRRPSHRRTTRPRPPPPLTIQHDQLPPTACPPLNP